MKNKGLIKIWIRFEQGFVYLNPLFEVNKTYRTKAIQNTQYYPYGCITGGCYQIMKFDTTVYNISVISWRSVLLVEETRVSRANPQPTASH